MGKRIAIGNIVSLHCDELGQLGRPREDSVWLVLRVPRDTCVASEVVEVRQYTREQVGEPGGYLLTLEWADVTDGAARVVRRAKTRIPIAPYAGLRIGAMVVRDVLVNQGAENGDIEVEYEPVSGQHAEVLESQNWSIEETL